jgi:Tfp pilus assembly protein PilF/mono/diheme cytochrome c family protein
MIVERFRVSCTVTMNRRVVRIRAWTLTSVVVACHPLLAGEQASSTARPSSTPTFTRDIAPIVFQQCAPCHRPAGSGPFPLLTYEDAGRRAQQIAAVTRSRIMPPWKPEPGHGDFVGARRLTDDQIALVQHWVDGGATEGDPRLLPALPAWSGTWQLGEPDLILQMPPYVLRAGGEDMYRNFVIPIPAGVTRYIKAWQFIPGNPRVVHHATMQFDSTGRSRELDAEDPEPGYEGLIAHSVQAPDGYFLDWGPGHTPYIAPEGMAWPLPTNSDLVMMLHLKPSGKHETVQASVGLYFSDAPPSRVPTLVRLTRQHLDIPPGDRQYRVTDSFTLDVAVDVYTVQPHAHYLAKDVKGFATLPDGTRKWLIDIRNWDFNWQGVYRYANPVVLPAGTMITMEYLYDNSAGNPFNPSVPPRRVRYGQRTTDEMAELWLQVVARTAPDRATLAQAVRGKIAREEIVGHEKMLESDPGNVALHDDVALLYAQVGDLEGTAAHFAESLRMKPDSPAAHYNLGTALVMLGRRETARDQFKEAIAIRPEYALALTQLAWLLSTSPDERMRQPDEAVRLAERAAALTTPQTAGVLDVLAAALAAAGRFDRAVMVSEAALALTARDETTAAGIRGRLQLYRQHQPYVER